MKNPKATFAFVSALLTSSAFANTISFSGIPSGGTKSVDVSAVFTTGVNSVSVTIYNATSNPTSVVELISGLNFTFSGGSTLGASLLSSSATELTVNSTAVGGYSVGGSVATGWGLTSPTSSSLFLNVLGYAGPEHLIIGPSNNGTYSGGAYAAANGGIAGNPAHNPFLESGATFNITGLPGVTANTTITSAQFFFGTTQGAAYSPPGNTPSVPDGGTTLLMLGSALAVLGAVRRLVKQ